jgi:hypothetical protein
MLGWKYVFKRQFQHLLFLVCLIPGAFYIAEPTLDGVSFQGQTDRWWFHLLLIVVVAHQVIVWFVFRTQLVFSLLTKFFGKHDQNVWALVFIPLLFLRPLLTILLGWIDAGSLPGNRSLQIIIGVLLLVPSLYGAYSVRRYFGIRRALGGDHFEEKYKHMPLVKEGAFKYTSNAMYGIVFLGLWSIALISGSQLAIASAVFQHAYIWVHMFCTEEPDMRVIYGK